MLSDIVRVSGMRVDERLCLAGLGVTQNRPEVIINQKEIKRIPIRRLFNHGFHNQLNRPQRV
jgi:hypothetical protein